MNRPTTISAIVSLFTMLASRWMGSCEPTISMFTRSCPRVSMREATFSSFAAASRLCSASCVSNARDFASSLARSFFEVLAAMWSEMIWIMFTSGMNSSSNPSSVTSARPTVVTVLGTSMPCRCAICVNAVSMAAMSRSARSTVPNSLTITSRSASSAG